MWIKPEEVLIANALWCNEQVGPNFVFQRRRGHGTKGMYYILCSVHIYNQLSNLLNDSNSFFNVIS